MQRKRDDIQLLKPIPAPSKFTPSETWVEGDFVMRLDPELGIVKRSPVTRGTSVGTMYFSVGYAEAPTKKRRFFSRKEPVSRQSFVEKPTPKSRPKPKLKPLTQPKLKPPMASRTPAQVITRINQKTPVNKLETKRKGQKPILTTKRFAIGSIAAVAVVAIGVLLYPVYPELKYRVYSTTPAAKADAARTSPQDKPIEGNRLWIPKIGVDTPILEGSDLTILDSEEGVWHQTGGYGYGNFVLAGHRFKYLPPNTSTLYNLDKLEPGDTLAVDWNGKREIFEVEKKIKVNAKDLSILTPTFQQTVTIYTCSDEQETERIVIRAKPAAAR